MLNYYHDKMIELDADGIDFIPIEWFVAGRSGVPASDYYDVRHFFETYLTDKEVRRAIEDKKFQLLGTQIPSYSFAELKKLGVQNMDSVIGYVNDNINLSKFM